MHMRYEMIASLKKMEASRSGGSSATSCSKTVCSLVKNKLTSLRERLKNAEETNDHIEAIRLDAQIFLLESMWIEFIKFG